MPIADEGFPAALKNMAPGDLEYRLATHVAVTLERDIVHLEFFQPDPTREGEAVLVGRIALHPTAAKAVAERLLSKVS